MNRHSTAEDATASGGGSTSSIPASGVAGAAIGENDAIYQAFDGLLYPVESVNYASNMPGAQGGNPNGGLYQFNPHRQQGLFNTDDCSNYWCTGANGTGGLTINRNQPRGGSLQSKVVDNTAAVLGGVKIGFLSNGNIMVVWDVGTTAFKYMILDRNLQTVVASTGLATLAASGYWDAIPLVGGGFAICYLNASNAQQMATFDNAGAAVVSPTTIMNWTGTPDTSLGVNMVQLSSGDLAFAFNSRYGTTKGLYTGVFTVGAMAVSAVSNRYAPAGTPSVYFPEIVAGQGFFAVAVADTVNTKAFVLSNAGVVQGAAYSNTDANGGTQLTCKLVTDGVAAYLATQPAITLFRIVKLPATGTGYTEKVSVLTGNLAQIAAIDGFYKNGKFVVGQYRYVGVADVDTLLFEYSGQTNAGGTVDTSPGFIPYADFAGMVLTINSTSTTGYIYRFFPIAVVGVAAGTSAVGSALEFHMSPGFYSINPVIGNPQQNALNFDYTQNIGINAMGDGTSPAQGGGVKGILSPASMLIRSLT